MAVIDGKLIAKELEGVLGAKVETFKAKLGSTPGLGVILVGSNPASKTYVASKHKYAERCGVATFDINLPDDATQAQVEAAITKFNQDKNVHGILLQLPLPKGLDSAKAIRLIDPKKDADGLHPYNQGLLIQGEMGPRPCTPLGCMTLIDIAIANNKTQKLSELKQASLAGKKAVVIGRSTLVGKPMAFLLLERNATVTIVHSKTPDIEKICSEADILVAAVGVPEIVKGNWVKPGAIVIDVGINRLPDGKLVGDVDFKDVAPKASAITPVPGGVGPMTVSMLISNTIENWIRDSI